jgi:hypothetical protein
MARRPTNDGAAATLDALLRAQPFSGIDWHRATSPALHLRIGNLPPALDRQAALFQLGRLFDRIQGFGGFCEAWQRNEAVFVETEVLARVAERRLRLPCVIVARARSGLIEDLRFYLDPSPLDWEA